MTRIGRVQAVASLTALAIVASGHTSASLQPRAEAAPASVCEVVTDKTAAPTEVALGDEVEITLRVDARCPDASKPGSADIVLAIDRSASQVDNGTWEATKRAAGAFGDLVDFDRHQVAVLSFSGGLAPLLAPWTQLHQPLSSDGEAVKLALATLPTPPFLTGATNLTAAVEAAQAELTSARHRPSALPVIVLLSDGGHNAPTSTTPEDAARSAKEAGTLIITVGLAVNVSAEDTLRAMASRASLYYPAPSGDDLEGIYRELAGSVGGTGRLSAIDVVDFLSAGVEYVPGSAVPVPTEITATTLRWSFPAMPETGWVARYRVRLVTIGQVATNKLAYVDFLDADGSAGTRDFPVPVVTVRPPAATPTPGATPATASPAAFLPLVLRGYCKPGRPLDVALVLDTSSSMWGDNLNSARSAAAAFLRYLTMPPSRAAVLAFHDEAVVVQNLTFDRAAAVAALDRLPQDEGSRIDLALREATRVLTGADRDLRRQPVVLLITDGQQVGGSDQDALNASAAARQAGIDVFVIGFGAGVDPVLLQRIAGSPDRFYDAPDAASLVDIYVGIAGDLPCRYVP